MKTGRSLALLLTAMLMLFTLPGCAETPAPTQEAPAPTEVAEVVPPTEAPSEVVTEAQLK